MRLQWLGPLWRVAHGEAGVGAADRLRAGIALAISKRVHAAIRRALRNLRWQASERIGRCAGAPAVRSRAAMMRA